MSGSRSKVKRVFHSFPRLVLGTKFFRCCSMKIEHPLCGLKSNLPCLTFNAGAFSFYLLEIDDWLLKFRFFCTSINMLYIITIKCRRHCFDWMNRIEWKQSAVFVDFLVPANAVVMYIFYHVLLILSYSMLHKFLTIT